MIRSFQRIRCTRRGFSLLEVLFAVLILAVLSAVAIPLYLNTKADAQAKVCLGNLRSIATAEAKYLMDTGSYTDNGANEIAGQGIASIPVCPRGNTAYTITVDAVTGDCTMACANHAANQQVLVKPPPPPP